MGILMPACHSSYNGKVKCEDQDPGEFGQKIWRRGSVRASLSRKKCEFNQPQSIEIYFHNIYNFLYFCVNVFNSLQLDLLRGISAF
jgi:hypothetical protein